MTLAVTSKHTLDAMQEWVTTKFSEVINKDVVLPDLCSPHPFPEENRCKLVRFVPIKDEKAMTFIWTLPDFSKDIKGQPLSYFSHLIGHEGENSLLSYLKSEGLATELGCYPSHNLFQSFRCSIRLTNAGLDEYEKVIEATF